MTDPYAEAREVERDPSELTIRTPNSICVTDDPEPAYVRIRGTLAFHIARMGDAYHNQLGRIGHEDLADSIRAAWDHGGSKAGTEAVPEGLSQEFGFAGPAAAVADHLDEPAHSGFNLHAVAIAEPSLAKRASIYRTLVG